MTNSKSNNSKLIAGAITTVILIGVSAIAISLNSFAPLGFLAIIGLLVTFSLPNE